MFIRRLHKNTQVTLSYNAKGNKSQINTENNILYLRDRKLI